MKNLDEALKEVVELYAEFDDVNQIFREKNIVTTHIRQKIETHLITLFSQFITQDGLDIAKIDQHIKKLRLIFHPDKYERASPEIKWLENILSESQLNGACFKLIDHCAAEIKNPSVENDNSYANLNTMVDLINMLKVKRKYAKTYTQRALIDSIFSLLASIDNYDKTTEKMGSGWMQRFMYTMPYITSGFCIGLYIEELSLLYALTFSLSKGGKALEKSNLGFLQSVGREMQVISRIIASATSAFIAYFIDLNLMIFDKVYYVGIEACSTIYKAIIASPLITQEATPSSESDASCSTISLAHHLLGGRHFESLELKLLAINLEGYKKYQQQQYFAALRLGNTKSLIFENTLSNLEKIDAVEISTMEKLERAGAEIDKLADNRQVNVRGSHAGKAIMMAKAAHNLFFDQGVKKNEEEKQLLAYAGRSIFT